MSKLLTSTLLLTITAVTIYRAEIKPAEPEEYTVILPTVTETAALSNVGVYGCVGTPEQNPAETELETEEPEREPGEGAYGMTATTEELEDVARVVWLEARGETECCQKHIAEVIFNRLRSGIWGETVTDVLYAPGQFEPIDQMQTAPVEEEIISMVIDLYQNGYTMPENVLYFRSGQYHTFAEPAFQCDHMYFSYGGIA